MVYFFRIITLLTLKFGVTIEWPNGQSLTAVLKILTDSLELKPHGIIDDEDKNKKTRIAQLPGLVFCFPSAGA